jgi:dTDP-4-dehydrorhamnose 3,5-epimerase
VGGHGSERSGPPPVAPVVSGAATCHSRGVGAPTIVPLQAEPAGLTGLWRIRMKQVTDERGTIREFYRESAFVAAGLPSLGPWVQLNVTETGRGVVRGLHGEEMHKLVAVAAGEALGVYVDARRHSPSFGRTVTVALGPGVQVLVPPGVCNGFQSVSPGVTQYLYAFDAEWVPGMAGLAVTPLDPDLGVDWPIPVDGADRSQVSAKDAAAPRLAELWAG